MGVTLQELADTEKANYKELVGEANDFGTEDWLKILTLNSSLIRSPIAMKGEKALIINTPTDILNL